MKKSLLVVTGVLALLWQGCGGGSSGNQTPTAPSPSPTQPAPAPAPSPGPTPSPPPARLTGLTVTYIVDAGVPEGEQSIIRESVEYGHRFFADIFGSTSSGELVVRIAAATGSTPAFAGGSPDGTGRMTFNVQHPVWLGTTTANKRKIAIHELFHVHQGQKGMLGADAAFPRWFTEGSAEYMGYQGIAAQGLLPFGTARRCMMFSVARNVERSFTLRAGGIPPSGGYWLAFMGIDYMSNSDPRTLARIYSQAGGSWDAKLLGATGTSADTFFDQFEATRQAWSVPSSYECSV